VSFNDSLGTSDDVSKSRYSARSHWQRSATGTPASASSMWPPQPNHVGLVQLGHVTLLHMCNSYLRVMAWMSMMPSLERKASSVAGGVVVPVDRTIIAVLADGLGPTAIEVIEIPA